MATDLQSTPTFDELSRALVEAHNAGETAHAQRISEIIKEMYPEGKVEITSQTQVQEILRATEEPNAFHEAAQNITQQTLPTTQVMVTLGEGQAVLQRADDGKTYYVDQNARIFTDNEAVIQAAMTYKEGGVHPNEVYKQEQAREYFASEGETKLPFMTEGFRRQAQYHSGNILQGFMGGGSWLDEITGKTMGDDARADWEKTDEMGDIAYPWLGIAENLAGAVTSGIAIGTTKYPVQFYQWVNKLPFVQKGFMAWLGGAGFGGVEGILYGAGDEDREGSRYEGGKRGGERGLLWGGFGNLVGQRISDIMTKVKVSPIEIFGTWKVKEGLKDTSIKDIQAMFGDISSGAARIIKDVVASTGISFKEALANLRKGGSQSMIADIDVATEVLADAVSAAGGESASIIQSAVLERSRATSQSLERGLDKHVADLPPMKEHPHLKQDPVDIAKKQAIDTAPARQEAYTKAFQHKVNYNSAEGKAVLEVLDAMPKKVKNQALSEVNDLLKMDGLDAYQIDLDFVQNEAGELILTEFKNLNMTQLDYIKRALSKIAYESEGVLKAGSIVPSMSALSLSALKQRHKLSEALKKMNPDYAKAVKLGQDKITRENALEVGFLVMTKQLSPQDLARALQGAGEAEKAMARMGLRASLDDLLNNIKGTATRRDVDVKGMDTLWSQLSSKANRTKIKMILGTKEYNKLIKLLDKAEAAIALRVAVAPNSKTAVRLKVMDSVEEMTGGGALRQLSEARPAEAARTIIQKIMQTQKLSNKHKAVVMKELAEAMTDAKGAKTIALYRKLYKAVKNGEATDAELARISDIIITRLNLAPLAVVETGRRELETRAK